MKYQCNRTSLEDLSLISFETYRICSQRLIWMNKESISLNILPIAKAISQYIQYSEPKRLDKIEFIPLNRSPKGIMAASGFMLFACETIELSVEVDRGLFKLNFCFIESKKFVEAEGWPIVVYFVVVKKPALNNDSYKCLFISSWFSSCFWMADCCSFNNSRGSSVVARIIFVIREESDSNILHDVSKVRFFKYQYEQIEWKGN